MRFECIQKIGELLDSIWQKKSDPPNLITEVFQETQRCFWPIFAIVITN